MTILLFNRVGLSLPDGRSFPVQGLAARLLAFLVVTNGRASTREEIATALWPDDDPESTRSRLRQALHALRTAFENAGLTPDEYIDSSRSRLALNPSVVADVHEFERLCTSATASESALDRVALLTAAIELHRGILAPECDGDWIEPHRARVASMQRSALLDLAHCYETIGDLDAAMQIARRAVTEEPLSEETHCQLMRLYSASGRPGEVLRQYRDLERILDSELGEKPSAATRELATRLREGAAVHSNGTPASAIDEVGLPITIDRRSTFAHPRNRKPTLIGALVVLTIAAGGLWYSNRARLTKRAVPGSIPEARLIWQTELKEQPGESSSEPVSILTGANGQIFVSGFRNVPKGTDADYLIEGLVDNGTSVGEGWTHYYDGPSHDVDRVVDATWSAANVFAVVGESDNGSDNKKTHLPGLDIAVVWYDAQGLKRSVDRWDSDRHGEDHPTRACSCLDRLYVCGYTWLSGKDPDARYGWVVLQYGPDGGRKWYRKLFDETSNIVDARATDMAPCGKDVVVTGYVTRKTPSGFETACILVQIRASDGAIVKMQELCLFPGRDTTPWHIGTHERGFAITGPGHNYKGSESGDGTDILTMVVDPSGNLKWARTWNGATNRNDAPQVVRAGSDGRIYVTGRTETTPGSSEIVTICYSQDGELLWCKQFAGFSRGLNGPRDLAISNRTGDVYVAGITTQRQPTGYGYYQYDALLLKYDRSGNLVWKSAFDGQNQMDMATAVTLDPAGNVLLAGQTNHDNRPHSFLRKYAP